MPKNELLQNLIDTGFNLPKHQPYPELTDGFVARRLDKPAGKVDVVMDTDTFNEIDDQYAISYMLKHDEKFNVQAIYAATVVNEKMKGAPTAAVGMEKSYDEIFNILKLLGREDMFDKVYRGSTSFLHDEQTPVISDAAKDLVEKAMLRADDDPLYVIAIGAISNVASALLMKPEIAKKIVVVWLGGHSLDWPDTMEFNMVQDIAGARVLLTCGVPVVLFPCMGVVSSLATTGPELQHWLKGKNALCDYLCDITCTEAEECGQGPYWSRAIWDVAPVAWFLSDAVMDRLEPAPIPSYDGHYSIDKSRYPIRYVYALNRDKIMGDLFETLTK